MKIIVGGAGNVGRSIVDYLSRGNNDIIVVDTNQDRLNEISHEFDIQPVLGSISHPEVQEKIGADTADILIAATNNDEVNLVACQVAYTLFNVPKKIARVDSKYFLSPLWNTLYNEKSLPIDVVISPDHEIAALILKIINLPGTREVFSIADQKLLLTLIKCENDCPLFNFTIAELYENFKETPFSILQILREGKNFYPKPDESLKPCDEIYLLSQTQDTPFLLHAFGTDQTPNENVLIFGGNTIAYDIAKNLEQNDAVLSCRIITNDPAKAQLLAEHLNRTAIIQGEMMTDVILKDAGIDTADITIAITGQDKDNLLASLLASHNHICSTVSLVNSRAYDDLIDNIGDNIIIDRSTVTISKIIKDIRKVPLDNAFALGRGFAEIWEMRIWDESFLENKAISELNIPEKCRIAAIVRQDQIIFPQKEEKLQTNDLLILFVAARGIKKMEQIFNT